MNDCHGGGWRMYSRRAAYALAVLYAVGVAGHAWAGTLPTMLMLTPTFTALTAAAAMAPAVAAGGGRFGWWVVGTYLFTFLAEAVGVATGAVFGQYEYGSTLGWAWRGVPLVIAFNWAMVVNGSVCIAERAVPRGEGVSRRVAIALLAGLIATAFDFAMEPVAMRLDYWRWPGNAVPLQNYAAWFGIAVLAAAAHPRLGRPSIDPGPHWRLGGFFVVLQATFFLSLRVVWHFQGA